MTMVNKYPGPCAYCSAPVPANGGKLLKTGWLYQPIHLACEGNGKVDVYSIGGKIYYRNSRGRCEDAPCCGCCNI
jgi:hypothetical protein